MEMRRFVKYLLLFTIIYAGFSESVEKKGKARYNKEMSKKKDLYGTESLRKRK